MGKARQLLVARRSGRPRQAFSRCPAIISEATNSHREVLSGGCIVSLQLISLLRYLFLLERSYRSHRYFVTVLHLSLLAFT